MSKRKSQAVTISSGRAPRVRKTSTRKPKAPAVELVGFTARFHENERAHLKCSCTFSETCDGSRVLGCIGALTLGDEPPECNCPACPTDVAEHVNGCQGCENCLASVCAGCGKREPSVPAVEGETWTCSPECTRKALTGAA